MVKPAWPYLESARAPRASSAFRSPHTPSRLVRDDQGRRTSRARQRSGAMMKRSRPFASPRLYRHHLFAKDARGWSGGCTSVRISPRARRHQGDAGPCDEPRARPFPSRIGARSPFAALTWSRCALAQRRSCSPPSALQGAITSRRRRSRSRGLVLRACRALPFGSAGPHGGAGHESLSVGRDLGSGVARRGPAHLRRPRDADARAPPHGEAHVPYLRPT